VRLELPELFRFDAPDEWRSIEFISDLHLNEAHPRTFDAWAGYLDRSDADAVFILGDLFEVWVGDDARHGQFERRCAEVLTAAARRRRIGFMAGNRDFLVGHTLLDECGVMALPDPTLLNAWDHRVLLTHGDGLCLADTAYQAFRKQVRNPAWRAAFLARPMAERQELARHMRDASESVKASAETWSDIDPPAAVGWLEAAGAEDMVHGHTHQPGSETLAAGHTRHVLSDWDLDAPTTRGEVLRLTRQGYARNRYPQ
jgi:UDP-2,3-diacylglucosamine hydrolase